jgi:hypothetical protein
MFDASVKYDGCENQTDEDFEKRIKMLINK